MTSEVIITRPVWEEYRRIKPRLRNQALAALIEYLMTGEKPAFSRNINTPFNQLLVTYKESTESLHSSRTHLALIARRRKTEESIFPLHPYLERRRKRRRKANSSYVRISCARHGRNSSRSCRRSSRTNRTSRKGRTSQTSPRPKQEAAEHSPSWGRWRGLFLSWKSWGLLLPSHPRRSLPPRGSEGLQLRPRRLFQPLRIERLARGAHKNEKLAFGLYHLGTQSKNLWKLPTIYLCNAPRRRPPSWARNCPRRHPPNCQQSLLNSNGATPPSRLLAKP